MNEPYSTVSSDAVDQRRAGWIVPGLILVALLLGALGLYAWTQQQPAPVAPPPATMLDRPATGPVATAATPGTAPATTDPATLSFQIAQLEARLARLSVDADAAASRAARAETILVIAAVRRAMERGQPLGYLDNELQQRFGATQPKAVASIIAATRAPVKVEDLRTRLAAMTPEISGELPADADWWTRARHEMRNLFILRDAQRPVDAPALRVARARRLLDADQVGNAIAEIEVLPQTDASRAWLADARRIYDARRGLDLIEAAAIIDPREVQPAPAPPST